MSEDLQITRRWNLVRMLGARRLGVTVRELKREFGVSEKTIRRDLAFLRQVGFPVEEQTEDYGRKVWKLGESWSKSSVQFTFDEAAALYLGRKLLDSMAGTPFWSAASSAWRKIRSTMGERILDYLDRFSTLFHCTEGGHRNYASKAAILESLTVAMEDYKAAHITYRSDRATEAATREVYPLKLVRHYTGALYLRAVDPEDDAVKTYKIDRIEAVEVSQFVFQRYRGFDAAASLAGSLGIYEGDGDIAVAIRFLPASARHARETRWHTSEVFIPQRDGSLILRLRLSSTVEIKGRVLSYGASAIVLEPEGLRAEIAEELRRMLETYRTPTARNQPGGEIGGSASKSRDARKPTTRNDAATTTDNGRLTPDR